MNINWIFDSKYLAFSIADIVIISALIVGGTWWFYWRQKFDDFGPANVQKKFSIYPTPVALEAINDRSFIRKLKSSGRSLVVFYGSQTGTGEEFASRLAKDGIRYKMKGMVADPEEYDMEELCALKSIPNSMVVFCLATYGEGDPTDNAMEFVDWLKNNTPDLKGLNYAVFGLGNKTYEHYNEIGIYVDERLHELGATRVYELGLGDDDKNIEDDFITWKDKFWPAVCEHFNIETTGEDISVRQYRLTIDENIDSFKVFTGEMSRLKSIVNQRPPFDAKNPFMAEILVNRELHKSGDRSCMHIELSIDGSKMRYEAGDHIAIYPTNDCDLVEKMGRFTKTDLDTVFTLTNTDEDSSKKHPFPCPCSYRTALSHYLDITMNPRTHVLKELSEYCTDPDEKARLKLMSTTSADGKALYLQWIIQANRNIVHVLEDMPSCCPPLDHVCELLPRLQPRYYSISSSPKLYPSTVHVTAVVVKYQTPTGRLNKGVATCWLSEKKPQANQSLKVPVFIRKSQFRLPARSNVPIVMIGPGTGVAPFRAFLQERQATGSGAENILYFGCRNRDSDFIYEDELNDFVTKNVLKLYTAFSRDQNQKVYVTHLLEQNRDELWSIIGERNGHIYICGDAKTMATDVRNILLKVIKEKNNWTNQQAQDFLRRMETQRRYSADVWS